MEPPIQAISPPSSLTSHCCGSVFPRLPNLAQSRGNLASGEGGVTKVEGTLETYPTRAYKRIGTDLVDSPKTVVPPP